MSATAALSVLGALLGIVTLLGGFASSRLHGAYRAALRDLRESERRLDAREAGHVDGRLEPELRWLAEVRDAARDSRWRESALLMGLLCLASVTLAVWTLTSEARGLAAFAVVVLTVAAVLVTLLLALDGRRVGRTLAATARQSRLWGLLQLENALSDTQRATVRRHAAHRAWLRALAARHPLAGLVARWRERGFRSAERRRQRAVERLATRGSAVAVLDDLRAAGVRPPDGYVDGVRGLIPLVGRGAPRLDDDAEWDTALADLTRAVERDAPRRLRWLSALAACAELRDDPVARESAARWTLDMAALAPLDPVRQGPVGVAADRYDPLPDAALAEPRRPTTWAGALRRARETGARPDLLASVLVRWAYALVLDRPGARDVDTSIAPAVDAAVETMHALPEPAVDHYLRLVRAGFADLGASGAQMGRLVPPRAVPTPPAPRTGTPPPAAPAADAPPSGATAAGTDRPRSGNTADQPSGATSSPTDRPRGGATAARTDRPAGGAAAADRRAPGTTAADPDGPAGGATAAGAVPPTGSVGAGTG